MLILNNTLKQILFAASIAMLISTSASYAHDSFNKAGARQGGNASMGMRVLRQLDLSDEQTTQIKELFTAQREVASANRDRMQQARELSAAGDVDQAAQIAADLAREKVLARAANQQSIEALLTPEQVVELNSIKDKVKERGQRRGGNRGGRSAL